MDRSTATPGGADGLSRPGNLVWFIIADFFRLCLIFLPIAFVAPILQIVAAKMAPTLGTLLFSLSSFGSALVWLLASAEIVIPGQIYIRDLHEWLWVFTVVPVNSIALIMLRKVLPKFWAVCAAWGGACLAVDAMWGSIPWSDPAQAVLAIGFNLIGGLLVGLLFWKPLTKVAITESELVRQRQARMAHWALPPPPGDPIANFRIDIRGIVTGYVAVQTCFTFWFAAAEALLSSYLVLFMLSDFIGVVWPFALIELSVNTDMLLGVFLTCSLPVFMAFAIYMAHKLYLKMMGSLLLYRPVPSWVYFTVCAFVLIALNIGARWLWQVVPTPAGGADDAFRSLINSLRSLIDTWLRLLNLSLGTLMVGLIFSGTSSIPLWLTALPPIRRLDGAWHALKSRVAQLAMAIPRAIGLLTEAVASEDDKRRLLRGVAIFSAWASAVSQPLATTRRLLRIPGRCQRMWELLALSGNSILVSLAVTWIAAWAIHVPKLEILTGSLGRSLAILVMMLGGLSCHAIFRIFGLPSQLTTTLLLYSVPQALFLPILAALSLPYISLEHAVLADSRRSRRPRL